MAFDKVHHVGLLSKLSELGIHGQLYTWVQSFLTGRRQCVAVEGAVSTESGVGNSVPQGSVLGPVWFLAHIANINGVLQHRVASSFADDTRLFKTMKSILKGHLGNIYRWTVTKYMVHNGGKFEFLRFTIFEEAVEYEYRDPPHLHDIGGLSLLALNKALVIPLLEYCCQLWGSTVMDDIRPLEAVQIPFTGCVAGLAAYNYLEWIQQMN